MPFIHANKVSLVEMECVLPCLALTALMCECLVPPGLHLVFVVRKSGRVFASGGTDPNSSLPPCRQTWRQSPWLSACWACSSSWGVRRKVLFLVPLMSHPETLWGLHGKFFFFFSCKGSLSVKLGSCLAGSHPLSICHLKRTVTFS